MTPLLPPLLHGASAEAPPAAVGWGALVAGLLLAAYGLRAGVRSREGRAYLLAGLALAGIAGLALLRGASVEAAGVPPRNPFPLSPESVAAGRRVYEQHCAACHGRSGWGDGPASELLPRRPADFRAHVPMHTDGQLYVWITRGIPGSPMPGFRDRLRDEDRWHVVNYLRVLALSAR